MLRRLVTLFDSGAIISRVPLGAWNCDLLMWQDYRVDGAYGAIKERE